MSNFGFILSFTIKHDFNFVFVKVVKNEDGRFDNKYHHLPGNEWRLSTTINDCNYRPQTKFRARLYFYTSLSFCSQGGVRGCSGREGGVRGCSGGHVWLLWGGMCGSSRGGMHGCSGGVHVWLLGGACVVLFGGTCMVLFRGACMVLFGGACVVFSVFSDTMRYGQ